MTASYSLSDAISFFFTENTSATRHQCDNFALSRVGGWANPVQIQGAFSYTLTTSSLCRYFLRSSASRSLKLLAQWTLALDKVLCVTAEIY